MSESSKKLLEIRDAAAAIIYQALTTFDNPINYRRLILIQNQLKVIQQIIDEIRKLEDINE